MDVCSGGGHVGKSAQYIKSAQTQTMLLAFLLTAAGCSDDSSSNNSNVLVPENTAILCADGLDNDGNGIKGDTSYTKSAAITKALTREYGLTFGKGKDKVRRERLKGKDAIKYRLFDSITAAVKESVTWDELRKLLAAKGISLDFVKDKDSNIRGVAFTDSKRNITFAGSKIDRSLSFANIDRQMYNVIHVDDDQDDETLQLHQEQEKPFDINDAFDFSLMSGGTRQSSEDAVEQVTTPSDGSSSGSGIGEAIVDVLLQPNVAPVSSGGGGSASGGWRDDDDEKNKNSYKPRKRR